ncbi:NAD(P)H-hydrate dehydratase [Pedobacter frigoris]|uniref:ADP-dependent (S)-NAD(P)H-hydrate dehydratase n=1 Tax=Pedobacter frigoris TaxID=2571272 RepID=A0A4U1CL10_9SPHI|nr:NAD(P)H-hydrate dehydratase [Pedobacter frigoris]TKC07346.1 NAD(P)H-hydrate dehydratase [Pedobacter frigoris]
MAVFLSTFLPDTDAESKVQLVATGLGKQPSKEENATRYRLVTEADVKNIIKPRKEFSHKGTYGHALIIAGTTQTMGAALLAAKGALVGGAGLTTLTIPESGLVALNTALPEVMYTKRKALLKEKALDKYTAIAVGPGIGKGAKAEQILEQLFSLKREFVADADALNILAGRPDLLNKIEKHAILTPHVKEFDRLFGAHENWWNRLQTAIRKAVELGVVIVLKNQYTFIVSQRGEVFINPTGNPAMAQGGMGDVLTGLITAYIAQGYSSTDAAILGCYIHGMAGDELAKDRFNITASQLAEQIPRSRYQLQSSDS